VTYQAVDPEDFHAVVSALPIRFEDHVFIDYGAGKGRALLMATRYPFRRIIGVEYSPRLASIAVQNLRTYNGRRACAEVEVCVRDAADYELPLEPLVLFFFNPFGRQVMAAVAARVAASWRSHPRPITVIYLTPYEAETWEATGIFHRDPEHPEMFHT
jgi:predicted RNA methylase